MVPQIAAIAASLRKNSALGFGGSLELAQMPRPPPGPPSIPDGLPQTLIVVNRGRELQCPLHPSSSIRTCTSTSRISRPDSLRLNPTDLAVRPRLAFVVALQWNAMRRLIARVRVMWSLLPPFSVSPCLEGRALSFCPAHPALFGLENKSQCFNLGWIKVADYFGAHSGGGIIWDGLC